MPQVYKKKTGKGKRSPKKIVFLAAKECDKGQSIRKAALMFNESIFIKIDIQNMNVLCGNIYRSPSNNIHSNEVFINTLHNCLDIIGPNKKCFIAGDLNYNLANHDNFHVSNFAALMLEKSYFLVINLPSPISDSNATVLDHI